MSVPQSVSKKNPEAAARARAHRAQKEAAVQQVNNASAPLASQPRPPPSPGPSYYTPGNDSYRTGNSFVGGSVQQYEYSNRSSNPAHQYQQPPQPYLSSQAPRPHPGSTLQEQSQRSSYHQPQPQVFSGGHTGGAERPISIVGPPKAAMMRPPTISASSSSSSLPLSAAYNLERDTTRPIDQPSSAPAPAPALVSSRLGSSGHPNSQPVYQSQPQPQPQPQLRPVSQSQPQYHQQGYALQPVETNSSNAHYLASEGTGSIMGSAGGSSIRSGASSSYIGSIKRHTDRLLNLSRSLRNMLLRRTHVGHVVHAIEIFSSNLNGHIGRLEARELDLTGQESRALASVARDFEKAAIWMEENQQNITYNWPPAKTAKVLKELDDGLTKSFTAKLGVAIFESLQDTRHISMHITRQIEGLEADLPGMIKRIVAQANSETIEKTIQRLRIEEDALKPLQGSYGGNGRPGGGSEFRSGYGGGEAEKTIQSLIDALETQRQAQIEKEERQAANDRISSSHGAQQSTGYPGQLQQPSNLPIAGPTGGPFSHQPPQAVLRDDASLRSTRSDSTTTLGASGGLNISGIVLPGSMGEKAVTSSEKHGAWGEDAKNEGGGISFHPIDPISKMELVDPVLASDGFIHDRFTLLTHKPNHPTKPNEPLRILGDIGQLRTAIFVRYPERKDECFSRRAQFTEEAVRHSSDFFFAEVGDVLEKLSAVLSWKAGEEDAGLLVRRGIIRWRIRHLTGALSDFQTALLLSPTLPIYRLLALVHLELHAYPDALDAVEHALRTDGSDSIALAVRAVIYADQGKLTEARRVLDVASSSANKEGKEWSQESRTSKAVYSPKPNRTPDTALPLLWDVSHLMVGFAFLALGESVKAAAHLAKAVEKAPGGDCFSRALWGYTLVESADGDTKEEGWRELEASLKLAGDIGSRVFIGEESEGLGPTHKPLQSAVGVLLAQVTAIDDKESAKTILIESLSLAHPGKRQTSNEQGFLARMYAETGDFEMARAGYDMAVAIASQAGRSEERAALMGERAMYGVA
ncbi:Tetratricopeptide repeat-containing domain [Phaffia rhodozyma]|uniref:Tetratricopeptide repeat-containing domain n=1 Tax=Phaffia rhodozyma TaxID=264483 RepID=A0A0F7SXA8_PHARH|nr:Tetratricopeptide repeat-containing domain [Phaffia rhodozyma]